MAEPKNQLPEFNRKDYSVISPRFKTKKQDTSYLPYVLMWVSLALIARLTIFIRRRPGVESAQIDGFAAAQIGLVVLACVLLFSFPYRSMVWQRVSRTSGSMIILYYALSGFSALWSPLPEYSLFRSVEYLSQMLLIFIAVWYCTEFIQAEHRVLVVSFLVILLGTCVNLKLNGFQLNLHN